MNIQFMDNENIIPGFKHYIPDFEALVKNASCDEEIEEIRNVEKFCEEHRSFGFKHEIIVMVFGKCYDYDLRKNVNKWQMFQYPWYANIYGLHWSKDKMVEEIKNKLADYIL